MNNNKVHQCITMSMARYQSFVCVWVLIFLEFCCHLQYSEARRGTGGGRGSDRTQSGAVQGPAAAGSRRSREPRVPYEWCPPCDVSHCPVVDPAKCPSGKIDLDLCHCCPICVSAGFVDSEHVEGLLHEGSSMQGPNFDYDIHEQEPGDLTANQSEACAKITCPKFQVCMLNIQDIPMCRCPTKFLCMKSKRRPVCGEDNVTYKSKCFLKMAECEGGRNIAAAKRGKCLSDKRDGKKREERLREKEEKQREREEKRRIKQEKIERRRRKKERKEKKERKRNRQDRKNKRWTRHQKGGGI